ncbi:hypothetical protein HYH02_012762 [Chlamydomonas schloesseri]|uniref:TLC domain-containing protein n=1 Tax=Chlamydomonas schloesseri TaxID=2026947 RepID=A0A835STY3_9CHLO|nr:hypothetical protein HYH02_012762 [Chlamydomonas schloesseri]|eukprot:KAG2433058.1 hypothetical protein HYH02_012762 [Chlamydomonas schloesseri]
MYLRRRGPGYEMYTPVVTEELWEGLGMSVLVALSSWALWAGHNARCHLTDTSGCLLGWPDHYHTPMLDALWLATIAWYMQSSVKHWFGLGRVQGLDTALHHAFSLTLLALGYSLELLRVGLLAHWLFSASAPLLSASKLLHCLAAPALVKKPLFVVYALAVLATRVLLVPLLLLQCTLRDVWRVPLSRPAAYTANGFLLLLYGISLFWFGRLIGIWVTGKLDGRPQMVMTAEVQRWRKHQ